MQVMASDLDSRTDRVKEAINSVLGQPGLLDDFTEEHLQTLAKENMTTLKLFRSASREQLRGIGIPLGLAIRLQAGGLQRTNSHMDEITMPTHLGSCTANTL